MENQHKKKKKKSQKEEAKQTNRRTMGKWNAPRIRKRIISIFGRVHKGRLCAILFFFILFSGFCPIDSNILYYSNYCYRARAYTRFPLPCELDTMMYPRTRRRSFTFFSKAGVLARFMPPGGN